MLTYEIKLTLKVSDKWIQDGANPAEWDIAEVITDNFLTYAYENEFIVTQQVVKQPTAEQLQKVMDAD